MRLPTPFVSSAVTVSREQAAARRGVGAGVALSSASMLLRLPHMHCSYHR